MTLIRTGCVGDRKWDDPGKGDKVLQEEEKYLSLLLSHLDMMNKHGMKTVSYIKKLTN